MSISIFGLIHFGKPNEEEMAEDPPYVNYVNFDPASPGFKKLNRLACPDCDCTKLWTGPSGGMSTNMCCAECRHCFNLTFYGGQLMSAERIRVGEEPDENGKLPG